MAHLFPKYEFCLGMDLQVEAGLSSLFLPYHMRMQYSKGIEWSVGVETSKFSMPL